MYTKLFLAAFLACHPLHIWGGCVDKWRRRCHWCLNVFEMTQFTHKAHPDTRNARISKMLSKSSYVTLSSMYQHNKHTNQRWDLCWKNFHSEIMIIAFLVFSSVTGKHCESFEHKLQELFNDFSFDCCCHRQGGLFPLQIFEWKREASIKALLKQHLISLLKICWNKLQAIYFHEASSFW